MSLSSTSVSKLHFTIIHLQTVEVLPALPFSLSFSMGISTPMDIYRKFHYVENTNQNINYLIFFLIWNFMAFYFFWKFFNRFINLLLIDFIMNLYTFIHIYTLIQEFGIVFYFGNLFRIYWQIYLQFVIQLSYLQQNSKGIYAYYITLSVHTDVCKYPLFVRWEVCCSNQILHMGLY